MNNLSIFFNTRVENSGAIAWIGDKGLIPFRYLFNGKTISIQIQDSDQKTIEIYHMPSFQKRSEGLSLAGMIKTALSIVLLIPGLLAGGLFKGLAYLFSDVREKHILARKYFTPVDRREIGSVLNPIRTREDLENAIDFEQAKADYHLTNTLIIHGDGNITINKDLGIVGYFNPMKLILEGVSIGKEPSEDRFQLSLRDELENKKWMEGQAKTIDDALQATAPRRSWISCKRYHLLFNFARPKEA